MWSSESETVEGRTSHFPVGPLAAIPRGLDSVLLTRIPKTYGASVGGYTETTRVGRCGENNMDAVVAHDVYAHVSFCSSALSPYKSCIWSSGMQRARACSEIDKALTCWQRAGSSADAPEGGAVDEEACSSVFPVRLFLCGRTSNS